MSQLERIVEDKKDAKKAKQQDKKVRQERAEFRGFVNYKPNNAEKAAFERWFEDKERVARETAELLDDRWKIGFARDNANGIYVPTIARWDAGHPESGIILNCRTKDVLLGHIRVVYALAHVYEFELSSHIASSTGEDVF